MEAGEFSIDLYTMPDILTKMLWDHLVSLASAPPSRLSGVHLTELAGQSKKGLIA